MDELVTIDNYNSLEEAYIVKGMLENNGIPALVIDDNNLYVPVFNGVRLQVRKSDENRAMSLIKSTNPS